MNITMRCCLALVVGWLLLVGSAVNHAAQPATQPIKLAADRAAKLKADLKTFTLSLDYSGPEDKPFIRLFLSVPRLPGIGGNPYSHRRVEITEAQAAKIIDYLATEGFLDNALDGNRNQGPAEPKGPHYTLKLRVDNNGDPVLYEEWLPWDMNMLRRLDGLRTVLEGDAAKNMDALLARLSGFRKQWQEAK